MTGLAAGDTRSTSGPYGGLPEGSRDPGSGVCPAAKRNCDEVGMGGDARSDLLCTRAMGPTGPTDDVIAVGDDRAQGRFSVSVPQLDG